MTTTQDAAQYAGSAGSLPFALPARVTVQEVGPRDGFQLEAARIATEDKIAIVDALVAAGVPELQLTAFVRPEAVPQLADAEQVAAGHQRSDDVRYSALVPNLRGAERALEHGIDVWELMLSVSDAHSIANANAPTMQAFERLRPVVDLAREHGVDLVGAMGTALGCPFEGRVPHERVVEVARAYVDAGVHRLTVADTAGLADPAHVHATCSRLARDVPEAEIALHLHDTRGLGMSNVLAGLAAGVTRFDSSVGGLGGCPYAPGATGNIATEELVHLLALLGVETGIDLDALVAVARGPVARAVGHRLESSFERADPSWVLHEAPERQVLPDRSRTTGAPS